VLSDWLVQGWKITVIPCTQHKNSYEDNVSVFLVLNSQQQISGLVSTTTTQDQFLSFLFKLGMTASVTVINVFQFK